MFIFFHSLSSDKLLTNCLPNISELTSFFFLFLSAELIKYNTEDYPNQTPENSAKTCFVFFGHKLQQHLQPISHLKTEQVHAEILLLYLHRV